MLLREAGDRVDGTAELVHACEVLEHGVLGREQAASPRRAVTSVPLRTISPSRALAARTSTVRYPPSSAASRSRVGRATPAPSPTSRTRTGSGTGTRQDLQDLGPVVGVHDLGEVAPDEARRSEQRGHRPGRRLDHAVGTQHERDLRRDRAERRLASLGPEALTDVADQQHQVRAGRHRFHLHEPGAVHDDAPRDRRVALSPRRCTAPTRRRRHRAGRQ